MSLPGAALACVAPAATLAEIQALGTAAVVTEGSFNPFEFLQDGKPTGTTRTVRASSCCAMPSADGGKIAS